MGSIRLTHIDGIARSNDPAILLAAVISSALLVFLTIKLLLFWDRTHGTDDRVARFILIGLFFAAYLGAGIFQCWFATALYREYHDIDPAVTLGLLVPVAPVWFVGAFSAGVFLVVRAVRRMRSSSTNRKTPR